MLSFRLGPLALLLAAFCGQVAADNAPARARTDLDTLRTWYNPTRPLGFGLLDNGGTPPAP